MAFKVTGLAETERALKKFDKKLGKDLNKKVGLEAATIVSEDAKTRVPVLTGRLQKSIRPSATPASAAVRSSLIYSAPIHFGWRGHNITPNPFLYDALDARRGEVVEKYGSAVERAAQESFGSG